MHRKRIFHRPPNRHIRPLWKPMPISAFNNKRTIHNSTFPLPIQRWKTIKPKWPIRCRPPHCHPFNDWIHAPAAAHLAELSPISIPKVLARIKVANRRKAIFPHLKVLICIHRKVVIWLPVYHRAPRMQLLWPTTPRIVVCHQYLHKIDIWYEVFNRLILFLYFVYFVKFNFLFSFLIHESGTEPTAPSIIYTKTSMKWIGIHMIWLPVYPIIVLFI